MSRGWNFADLFEALAERQPDALAQRHGGRSTTWAELDRRADGIAATLLDAGVAEQDKVAQYLYNAPEYLESALGAFKAGLATVNTNYRYTADELVYLWDNADVVAVVFHGTFSERIAELRHRLPRIHTWVWVDDGHGPCPEWATPYEAAAGSAPGDAHADDDDGLPDVDRILQFVVDVAPSLLPLADPLPKALVAVIGPGWR